MKQVKRGEIYYADLSPIIGSEQGGFRPVLVLQNDKGNQYSPTTIVAAVTSKREKAGLPTHVKITIDGLKTSSIVLLEQLREKLITLSSPASVSNAWRCCYDEKSIRQRPRLTCLRAEYASPSAVHEADYRNGIPQYRTTAGGTL